MVNETKMSPLHELEIKEDKRVHNQEEIEKAGAFFKRRFDAMKTARGEVEGLFDYIDRSAKQAPQVRSNGLVVPNLKMEEALIETYKGSLPEGLPINIISEMGKTDGILLEISKAMINHFIKVERINDEVRVKFEDSKARYGTGVLFSGVRLESKYVNVSKKEEYLSNNIKMKKKDTYHIGIKNVDVRDAWFSNTNDYDSAIDCVMKETLDVSEFKARYHKEKNSLFMNIKDIIDGKDDVEKVELYHYFNKIEGYYWIFDKEDRMVYMGYNASKHGELPLIAVQHYYNPYSIRGDGIPKRYATIKAMNNNLLTDILGGSRLNAGSLLFAGNGAKIDGTPFIDPGNINIVKMTSGNAKDMFPFNANVNVAQLQAILQLLDDYGIILTGLNFKAPYTSPAKTAFETSVMKEEQNNRLKNPTTLRNLGLSKAFNVLLCNILQFTPYLYAKRIVDPETGKTTLSKHYSIPLHGKKIIWKNLEEKEDSSVSVSQMIKGGERGSKLDDIMDIEEMPGYKDYFEMSDGAFDGEILENVGGALSVMIETPSSQSTMKALDVENINKLTNCLVNISQAKAMEMQSGGDIGKREQMEKKLYNLFNIDEDNIRLKTDAEKLNEVIAKASEMIMGMQTGTNDLLPNENNDEETLQQPNPMGARETENNPPRRIPDPQGKREEAEQNLPAGAGDLS